MYNNPVSLFTVRDIFIFILVSDNVIRGSYKEAVMFSFFSILGFVGFIVWLAIGSAINFLFVRRRSTKIRFREFLILMTIIIVISSLCTGILSFLFHPEERTQINLLLFVATNILMAITIFIVLKYNNIRLRLKI